MSRAIRSKPFFVPKLRIDVPYDEDRNRLISSYKNGGLKKYEAELLIKIGNYPISPPTINGLFKWTYVGEGWWCRKGRKEHEFSRLFSIINHGRDIGKLAGLWDDRIHSLKEEPVIVRSGNKSGVVVGYNSFELVVEWREGGIMTGRSIIKKLDNIIFDFEEDFIKFNKLLNRQGKPT